MSLFEDLGPGTYQVAVALPPRCPERATVELGDEGAELRLVLQERLDLGADQGQVGFDRTVEVRAIDRCPDGAEVSWALLEGDRDQVRFEGDAALVRTRRLDEVVDLDPRPGIVPIGPAAVQRFRLRASVGSEGAFDDVELTAAPRSGGVFQVPTGADVYLNGGRGEQFRFTLLRVPEGSAAVLAERESRTPHFRPDAFGTYRVREERSGLDLDLEAGRWEQVPRDCGRPECHALQAAGFAGTDHATTFERGIAGALGPDFGDRCAACHTVGWDPALDTGGFDDVARARGYSVGVGAEPPDAVRVLGNVWCTACHGPGRIVPTDESWEWGAKYSVEVCAQCHDGAVQAPTRVAEWRRARMARFVDDLAPGDPALERGCARCHSAQGFVAWQRSGSLSTLPDPRTVEPITCAACHDPHASRGPSQLRVDGGSLGSSALCATCHTAQASLEDPESRVERRAPHAPQGEIVLAAGSPHGAVPGACARCHMAGDDPEVGRHTFAMRGQDGAPNPAACVGCHAGLVDFEAVLASGDWDGDGVRGREVEEFDALLARLDADLTASVQGIVSDACGERSASATGESAGRIVLVDDAGLDLGDCDRDGRIGPEEHPAVIPVDRDDLYEAAFARLTAELDGSRGIHDPRGQIRMLQRAIAALGARPAPPWDTP